MQIIPLQKEQWKDYIKVAFRGDREIVGLYDKSVGVNTVEDVCESVFEKLSRLEESIAVYGVKSELQPVGYFAFMDTTLVSFGINPAFRTPEDGKAFFALLQSVQPHFSCYLFSYNSRAIRWLRKMGLEIIFENVTLLLCQ